jgi:hypothetical protein
MPALSMRPTFFSSPRPRSSTSSGTNGRTRLPPLPARTQYGAHAALRREEVHQRAGFR